MTQKRPIRTGLRVDGTPYPLPEYVEVNLLRIGQEALTNALRHAKPRRVDMTVTFAPSAVSLRIQDDGDGFDADQVGAARDCFGLAGMQERADQMRGTFTLDSRPKEGTLVEVMAPISRREAARELMSTQLRTAQGILVLIAVDHPLVRSRPSTIINHEPDIHVLA